MKGAHDRQPNQMVSTLLLPSRSPLLAAQTVPGQTRRADSLYHSTSREGGTKAHPALIHAVNEQRIFGQMSPHQDPSSRQSHLLRRDANRITPVRVRPVPHAARSEFMSLGSFEMTPELDDQAYSITGSKGFAYAGGARSGPIFKFTQYDSALEGAGDGPSGVQRCNTSSCDQARKTWELHGPSNVKRDPMRRIAAQQSSPNLECQRSDSSRHSPSLSDSGDHIPNTPLPALALSKGRTASPTAPSDPGIDHGYPHSPHSRPGAPIPPSSHSYTTTTSPSPSPLASGMRRAKGKKPVLPPYSPVPHVDSSYPFPFAHIRRRSCATSDNESMGLSQMDPKVAHEQNGGPPYNPRTSTKTSNALNGRPRIIADEKVSTRSSSSHQPVPLAPSSGGRGHPKRSQDLRRQSKTLPTLRMESTQPRDTSPELFSDDETPGESKEGEPQYPAAGQVRRDESAEDENETDEDDREWIDEGTEGVTGDFLQLQFHPDYVCDPKKRRRRGELLWEALLRAFRGLDRETDTTLVLLAAPSHTGKLHSVTSRAVRRDRSLKSTELKNIRSTFAEITSRQHAARPASLLEQLSRTSLSSRDGVPSSRSGARDENLRRALDTAITSVHALESLVERQQMRWMEEKHKLDEENEEVQLLLEQLLGVFGNLTNRTL